MYRQQNKARQIRAKKPANPFGDWNSDEYDVEELASGFVVMENGATIMVESSWALNTTDTSGVRYMICGTEAGVDNYNGKFKINGVCNNKLYITEPDLTSVGVAFTDGIKTSPIIEEQKTFINAILCKGELVTTPEKAAVVSQILEGIYISAATGKPYYFEEGEK